MDHKIIKVEYYTENLKLLIDLKESSRFKFLQLSEKNAIDVAISVMDKFIKLNNVFYDDVENVQDKFKNENADKELHVTRNYDAAYQALKKWRLELARRDKLPPYVILKNKTLESLSEAMPKTLYDLENIYGLGPSKIERYGEQVLSIIKKINNQAECESGPIKRSDINNQPKLKIKDQVFKKQHDDNKNIIEKNKSEDGNILLISREEFDFNIAFISKVFEEEVNENIMLDKVSEKFSLVKHYMKNADIKHAGVHTDKYDSIESKYQALNEFIFILDDIQDIIDIEDSNNCIIELRNLTKVLDDIPLRKRIDKEIRSLAESQESLPSRQHFSYRTNLNKAISTLERNAPNCSLCGSRMVIRSSNDNFHFWGCSTFPICFGKRGLTREQLKLIPDE